MPPWSWRGGIRWMALPQVNLVTNSHLEGGPVSLGQKPKPQKMSHELSEEWRCKIKAGVMEKASDYNTVCPDSQEDLFVAPSVPDSHPEIQSTMSSESDMDFENKVLKKRLNPDRCSRKAKKTHK